MATVNVQTTYTITPDVKTIAGYIAALRALVAAGAPDTTLVAFAPGGDVSITITDRAVINAIAGAAATFTPTQPKTLVGYP